MEECRLPKTSTRRGAITYAKLLTRVDPRAPDGFGFEGKLYRPGASIDAGSLSLPAILLECTDIEGCPEADSRHYRNRRMWDKLYILWRYEAESKSWVEIARTQCQAGEWTAVLREPARIALGRVSWAVVPSVAEAITRIRGMLDSELSALEGRAKCQVLGELHDQFLSRMIKASAA